MLKFSIKHQGTISVFLALIMLPCFIFSALIVDGSRMYASKTVVSSAGDLTMNAALSDFDTVLNDVYGLIAMADSPSAMSDNLSQYMLDIIDKNAGNDVAESEYTKNLIYSACDMLLNFDEDTDINSLLDISIETSDLKFDKVTNANLGNTSVLKNQILDYMRYRGPLIGLESLLSKFKQFSGVEKQKAAVDAETAYRKEEASFGMALSNAYEFFKKYQEIYDRDENAIIDSDKHNKAMKDFSDNIYKMYKYLLVANSYEMKNHIYWDAKKSYYDEKTKDNKPVIWKYVLETFKDMYDEDSFTGLSDLALGEIVSKEKGNWITKDSAECFMDEVQKKIDEADFKKYVEILKKDYNKKKDESDADLALRRFCIYTVFMNREPSNEYKIEDVLYLLRAYCNVYKYYEEQYADEMKKSYKTLFDEVRTFVGYYIDYNDGQKARSSNGYFSEDRMTGTYEEWKETLNKAAWDELVKAEQQFTLFDDIHNAREYLDGAKSWLVLAEKYYNNLGTKRSDWEKKAKNIDDENMRSTMEARVEEAKIENFTERITTLKGIVDSTMNVLNEMEKKYEAVTICDGEKDVPVIPANYINTNSSLYFSFEPNESAGLKKVSVVSKIKESDGVKAPKGIFELQWNAFCSNKTNMAHMDALIKNFVADNSKDSEVFSIITIMSGQENLINYDDVVKEIEKVASSAEVFTTKGVDFEAFNDDDNKIDIDPKLIYEKTFKQDSFYDLIAKEYARKDAPKDSKTEGEATGDVGKDLTSKVADSNVGSADDKIKGIITAISSEANKKTEVSKISGGDADDTEDNYSKIADSANSVGSSDLLSGFTKILSAGYDNLLLFVYMDQNFSCATTNVDPTTDSRKEVSEDNYATNLAGYRIDRYNNYVYQGELEYLLWGNENFTTNVNITKASIFGIRFALNTIYAFTAAQIQGVTGPAATAITAPLPFLQPLVNVALTLVWSCVESGLDLADLMNGKEVCIYKSANTWLSSLGGAIQRATNIVTENAIEYGINKIYEMVDNGLKDVENGVKNFTENSINKVNDSIHNAVVTPIINILYKVDSTIDSANKSADNIDKAIKDAETQIIAKLNSLRSEDNTSVEGMAKNAIIDYLVQNSNLTSVVLTPFKEYLNNKTSNAKDNITAIKSKIETMEKSIFTTINEKVTGFEDKIGKELKEKLSDLKDKATDEAKKAAKDAINKYTVQMTNQAQEATNNITTTGAKGSLAANLSMSYRDYVDAFLLIKLMAGQKTVLQRTGALISINLSFAKSGQKASTVDGVKQINKKGKAYNLSDAQVMIQMSAKYKIKTFFLASGVDIKNVTFADLGKNEGITMEYKSAAGY